MQLSPLVKKHYVSGSYFYQLLEGDGVDVLTLLDEYAILIPLALAESLITTPAPKPNFDFFKKLLSVFSLTEDELTTSFVTYGTCIQFLGAVLAAKTQRDEDCRSGVMSLFERLTRAGFSYVTLLVQYCMSPDIARVISNLAY